MQKLGQLGLVFSGGALGALLRITLLAIPSAESLFGYALVLSLINIAGAFLLALLLSALPAFGLRAERLRLLLGTGLLGGFTSYSALMFPAFPGGLSPTLTFALGGANLICGIAAALAGSAVGARVLIRRAAPSSHGGDA